MIRRICDDDVDVFRETRLRALADSPEAFGSTYAAEVEQTHAEWSERVRRMAAGADRAMFLAFADDDCVGLAGCSPDDYGADRQLISMWVSPDRRGTGVATDLVRAVVAFAADSRARTIALWVTKGNDRAYRFYERMGFALTGDVQPLPSDPCKDELRMIRSIGT